MWFKNLSVFRFTETFSTAPAELETQLQQFVFKPCGLQELSSIGWTPPLGQQAEQLVHTGNGFMMLCAKREERVLPSAVVAELVQEKIAAIEARELRKLGKKERSALKDEVLFELLPKAFVFSRRTYAYIDPKGGWLVVDSASAKKAEDLLSLLRKCLGSLPVVPPVTAAKPVEILTQWLTLDDVTPADITIEDECELRSPDENGGIVRCKRHDLSLPEIKNHLNTGKQVIKLALTWDDRLNFVLDENLGIKRLKFLDVIQEQAAETQADNAAEQFDVDFTIMTLELANFLPRLLDLFGGEVST